MGYDMEGLAWRLRYAILHMHALDTFQRKRLEHELHFGWYPLARLCLRIASLAPCRFSSEVHGFFVAFCGQGPFPCFHCHLKACACSASSAHYRHSGSLSCLSDHRASPNSTSPDLQSSTHLLCWSKLFLTVLPLQLGSVSPE
jgi:hypothetical protein